MKCDIAHFIERCAMCRRVKMSTKDWQGNLQPLRIPKWKWKDIVMDFVVGLPRTVNGKDAIWVIVDWLTKSAQFLPITMTDPLNKLI